MNDIAKVTSYARWRIEKELDELKRLKENRKEEIKRIDKRIDELRSKL